MRQVNPGQLEHLARLLDDVDGERGVAAELQQLFLRAANLGVRDYLAPLNPLQTWAVENAADLRTRAEIVRSDEAGEESSWRDNLGLVGDVKELVLSGAGIAGSFLNPWKYHLFPAPMGGIAINFARLAAGLEPAGMLRGASALLARPLPLHWVRALGGSAEAVTQNLWTLGRNSFNMLRASGQGVMSSLSGTGRFLMSSGGLLRWANIGGGLLATGLGLADLASQGWPWDAFRDDPSGYTVDATGTLFSASMTLALTCPHPGVAIAAGVFGLAYAGALVWDNWDAVMDRARAVGGWISDNVFDPVGDVVTDAADSFLGAVTGRYSVGRRALDMAEGAVDTLTEGAGDLLEGAADLGGDLVDGVGNLFGL